MQTTGKDQLKKRLAVIVCVCLCVYLYQCVCAQFVWYVYVREREREREREKERERERERERELDASGCWHWKPWLARKLECRNLKQVGTAAGDLGWPGNWSAGNWFGWLLMLGILVGQETGIQKADTRCLLLLGILVGQETGAQKADEGGADAGDIAWPRN